MGWAARDLRGRVRAVFGISGLLGVAGLVVVGLTFGSLLAARARLADRLDPAALASRDWLAALVNEETGVRGELLTRQPAFLDPYLQGRPAASASRLRLRRLLRDEPGLLVLADDLQRAVDAWQRRAADPLLGAARRVGAAPPGQASLDLSKRLFDEVRHRQLILSDRLDRARSVARLDLDRTTYTLLGAAVVATALMVASFAAVWISLRRWVIEPLQRLGAEARTVADGDLTRRVDPVGPPDVARLAGDVEAMRGRIVDELESVERSRVLLEEQAGELARSNEELEQFAYVASHDLQEPLRKISGFCQLLQRRYEGQLDERADEYLAFAVDGAARMQQLINDLLAFSRVGRSTQRFEAVPLADAVADACRSLAAAIADSGAHIDVGELPTVSGDRGLLGALFQNLIGNAIKFRGESPARVTVRAERAEGHWELSCADAGIGIEPAYAEQVFVIFQRLHRRDEYEGTGIGLALCRKIVEFHGGTIWIDPHPAVGTIVRWTLPDQGASR